MQQQFQAIMVQPTVITRSSKPGQRDQFGLYVVEARININKFSERIFRLRYKNCMYAYRVNATIYLAPDIGHQALVVNIACRV